MNTQTSGLDFAAVWSQGDAISHAVVLVLLLMSLASWSIILGKTWVTWKLRRKTPRALETFWNSGSLESGLDALENLPPFRDMARKGQDALRHLEAHRREKAAGAHLDAQLSASELVTRVLRNSIFHSRSRLEGGLTPYALT